MATVLYDDEPATRPRETFSGAQQAQDLHLARRQLRQPGLLGRQVPQMRCFWASRMAGRSAFVPLRDRLHQVVGIAGLGNITLGARFRSRAGEYRSSFMLT